MRALRRILSALVVTATAAGVVAIATPASAAIPTWCTDRGYANGRFVITSNDNNGGGALVKAFLCWSRRSDGYYNTESYYYVEDTAANGAGATPRFEWIGTDGFMHYAVPPPDYRVWTFGSSVTNIVEERPITGLYIRACLTNADSPAHHCGPKA